MTHQVSLRSQNGRMEDQGTYCEVHEVEELFEHLRQDGKVTFRQVLSHSSHIHLERKGKWRVRHKPRRGS